MKLLKEYKDGSKYIIAEGDSLEPIAEPTKVYDLSPLTDEELERLKRNKNDKKLLKKARKL